MKRIISICLVLSLSLCALAGCKGKGKDGVTDSTKDVGATVVLVDVPVATIKDDGTIVPIKNNDGSDIVVKGENGEQITLSADKKYSTLINAAGQVVGLKTDGGYVITVKELGNTLVIMENPEGKCEIKSADDKTLPTEQGTTEILATIPNTTLKPKPPKPATNPATTTAKPTTKVENNKVSELLSEAGIDKDKLDPFTAKILSYMVSKDGYFYTDGDPWQRNFGFNALYDLGAALAFMYYDTVRVKFNYNDLDWMIQLWKGQYGFAFIGAEIGVYTKEPSRTEEHYDCASNENMLGMSMTLYHYNEKLFTRPYGNYWWCTGFVPGALDKRTSPRSELTLIARIDFKSPEMAILFANGMNKAGFSRTTLIQKAKPETYKLSGKTVEIAWQYVDQKLNS